jgi:hypothetical protein
MEKKPRHHELVIGQTDARDNQASAEPGGGTGLHAQPGEHAFQVFLHGHLTAAQDVADLLV